MLNEFVYRPLAQLLVPALVRTGVKPETVVLAHTALGLLAAWQVAGGRALTPALLLQVKTVLDNADGQLARATGQTSALGRYLDSEMDLLVNAALLLAIDRRWGAPALVLLQLLLTVDFLLEREYREARGEVFRSEPHENSSSATLDLLQAVYRFSFEPQEKLLAPVFEARFRDAGAEQKTARPILPGLSLTSPPIWACPPSWHSQACASREADHGTTSSACRCRRWLWSRCNCGVKPTCGGSGEYNASAHHGRCARRV